MKQVDFKFQVSLVLLIGLLLARTIYAAEIRVHLQEPSALSNADIHRVKIYADQYAEIVHHMTVNVENPKEGLHDLVIDGFPNTLIDQSIRIVSTNDIDVLDHKISQFSYPLGKFPFLEDRVNSLRSQLSDITTALEGLRFQEQAFTRRLSQIESYVSSRFSVSPSGSTSAVNTLAPSEFIELTNFQETESNKVYSRLLTLSKEKEQKLQDQQLIQEELQKLLNPSKLFSNNQFISPAQTIDEKQLQFRFNIRKESLKIDTTTSSSKMMKLEFFFHYLVSPADWEANYLISIQNAKNPATSRSETNYIRENVVQHNQKDFQMEISQYGKVSQTTGMDWEDVDLYLTTSQPQSIFNIPMPARKAVYFQPQFQPQANMMFGSAKKRAGGAHEAMLMADRGESLGGSLSFEFARIAPAVPSAASVASNNVGGVDFSYIYHIQNPVNITSKWNPRRFLTSSLPNSYHHTMLIKSLTIPIDMFTYVAPAIDATAYRIAFGKFPTDESPLIPSYDLENSRIEIGDEYTGNTVFRGMQSGQSFQQNVGSDPLVKVSYLTSLPTNSQVEEGKNTWFVKDSIKYKVITEEKTITIKNSHSTEATSLSSDLMLFIVVDSVPSSTEENDIKVNLISPSADELVNIEDQKRNDEDFLTNILELEYEKKGKKEVNAKRKGTAGSDEKEIIARTPYICKTSGNIYWAVWTKPATSEFSLSLKYKITRPFDKEVFIY